MTIINRDLNKIIIHEALGGRIWFSLPLNPFKTFHIDKELKVHGNSDVSF